MAVIALGFLSNVARANQGGAAVAASIERDLRFGMNPVHAILLASAIPLFLGAVLSDWAYSSSYQIQWKNFASWLVVGGLVFTGLALLWSLVELLRADRRGRRPWLYFALILATFVLGFIDALVHAKDAWASMPAGFILSVIVFLLAVAANWAAHSSLHRGERP
ncbi:MAG TPA: DUF2231 domain-containing protein [Allosphingosinicella sp.]|nr:DUF2231 domain-containing protein [Allosphingosinicella sp.]